MTCPCKAELAAIFRSRSRACLRGDAMKQPTQRQARVMAKNRVGAFYLVIFNKNGKPEVSRFGSLTRRQADKLFDQWVVKNAMERGEP